MSDEEQPAARGESLQSTEGRQLEQLRSYQAWASTEIQSLTGKLRDAEARATLAERELSALKQGKFFRLADLYWRARYRVARTLRRAPAPPFMAQRAEAAAELTAGPHFRQAVLKHLEPVKDKSMHSVWVTYALTTNERGTDVLRRVQQQFGSDLHGKRLLDIGCAYGGTCLAFARAGAEAIGLEVENNLLRLAKANCDDHPELSVRLLNRDATLTESFADLGSFDVVTCDNVIEHVLDVPALLRNIATVLNPGGLCHLSIPNAWSLDEVSRDGHFGQFGISLLPRPRAEAYYSAAGFQGQYDVGYFFTLNQYAELFASAGLSLNLVNRPVATSWALLERLAQQVEDLTARFESERAAGKIPAALVDEVQQALVNYQNEFRAAFRPLRALPLEEQLAAGSELLRDYSTALWLVFCRPLAR